MNRSNYVEWESIIDGRYQVYTKPVRAHQFQHQNYYICAKVMVLKIFIFFEFIFDLIQMIKAASQGQQIQYVTFKDLTEPDLESITLKNIIDGLQSKEWRRNFDAITHLRQANKCYPSIFIKELFPRVTNHIIEQIDNLRSNNSKEALTLAHEIIEHQNLEKVNKQAICPIVSALFGKTVSQKAFLKREALAAVEKLPKKYNPHLLMQIANSILSMNGQISELGVKILCEYVDNNKITDVNGQFLSLLMRTINGKRAVLQKKGKQILNGFKSRLGQEKLIQLIQIARKQETLPEQEYRALLEQLKKEGGKQIKSQQSLKDYLMMKKKAQSSI